jgi:hypothetical protein
MANIGYGDSISTTVKVGPVASTSTPAICLPFTSFVPSSAESTTTFGTANTQEEVFFVMNVTFLVSNVTVYIGTGVAATTMGIAIYNAAGTTKLTAADAFSVASSNTQVRTALSSSITLQAGTAYWLAWTNTNSTTLTCDNFLMSASWQATYNAGAIRSGNSGTATTGGATNSTIGTVSSAQLRIPLMIFD